MQTDSLDALLKRFSVSAQMFHSGPLCGLTEFPAREFGQLHLLKRGTLRVVQGRRQLRIDEPSLLFYPRPLTHRFISDAQHGADMACANVALGEANPIARALPPFVLLPLSQLKAIKPVLGVLFEEAFAQRRARQQVVDRLFEVVLIDVLRRLMDQAVVDRGLLAGLLHPRLSNALIAIHRAPGESWSLEDMAARARMSRSQFAAAFHQVVGVAPGEYLTAFRITAAQDLLRRGHALKSIAGEVGYGSTAALSRAFRAVSGSSPRKWKMKAAV